MHVGARLHGSRNQVRVIKFSLGRVFFSAHSILMRLTRNISFRGMRYNLNYLIAKRHQARLKTAYRLARLRVIRPRPGYQDASCRSSRERCFAEPCTIINGLTGFLDFQSVLETPTLGLPPFRDNYFAIRFIIVTVIEYRIVSYFEAGDYLNSPAC